MDVLLLRTEEGYVRHLGDVSSLELALAGGRKSTLLRTTKKRGLKPFRLTNEMLVDTNRELLVRIRSQEERLEEPVPMGTTILVAGETSRNTKTQYVSLTYVSGVLLPDNGSVDAPAICLQEVQEKFQATPHSTH